MGLPSLGTVLWTVALSAGALIAVSDYADEEERSTTNTTVTRVIDGDTVEISSGEHVRLIGVDTPEQRTCGYADATEAMRRMVEGREVKLVNPESVQDLDRYDRLLRYVVVDDIDTGFEQIRTGLGVARYDSLDGYDAHPRQDQYRKADKRHEGACEERQRIREQRQRIQDERWRDARRLAKRANITVKRGETATQVMRRARVVISERRRLRDLALQTPPPPPQAPAPPPPPPPPSVFVPPAGWTTDALTPGYTGCRQGYPGGRINGVYVWKPIPC